MPLPKTLDSADASAPSGESGALVAPAKSCATVGGAGTELAAVSAARIVEPAAIPLPGNERQCVDGCEWADGGNGVCGALRDTVSPEGAGALRSPGPVGANKSWARPANG